MIIIMCVGYYENFKEHKSLSIINGEKLIERTIRLLKENGIEDYYISSNDDRFKEYGKIFERGNVKCHLLVRNKENSLMLI